MTMTTQEWRILQEQCAGHPVAACDACMDVWELTELCAAVHGDGTVDREQAGTLCPTCGKDLFLELERHIAACENFFRP